MIGQRISKKVKKEMAENPFYSRCSRFGIGDHVCEGRVTREHVVIYAGKQLKAPWSIIPLCAKAHEVDQWQDGGADGSGDLSKEINLWIALNRASDEELNAVSKVVPYARERARLNQKYGKYDPPPILSKLLESLK